MLNTFLKNYNFDTISQNTRVLISTSHIYKYYNPTSNKLSYNTKVFSSNRRGYVVKLALGREVRCVTLM